MPRQVSYSAFIERKADDAIAVAMPDGTSVTVPDPALWPDNATEIAKTGDNVALARMLLGEQFDTYIAAGGQCGTLVALIGDAVGVDVGESSASST